MRASKKIKSRLIILIVILFISNITSYGQPKNRDIIIGKWLFVKFEWPESVPSNAKIVEQAGKDFIGVTYTFTKDSRFIMAKKGGEKNWNKNTSYKFSSNNTSVTLEVGQTMEVSFLNEDTMTIYVKGFDPIGIFKKIL